MERFSKLLFQTFGEAVGFSLKRTPFRFSLAVILYHNERSLWTVSQAKEKVDQDHTLHRDATITYRSP